MYGSGVVVAALAGADSSVLAFRLHDVSERWYVNGMFDCLVNAGKTFI